MEGLMPVRLLSGSGVASGGGYSSAFDFSYTVRVAVSSMVDGSGSCYASGDGSRDDGYGYGDGFRVTVPE
jgi:hypothetical protein